MTAPPVPQPGPGVWHAPPAALPPRAPRRRRPSVLDASRAAIIPLRPLTIGEILDAGFTVLRANARTMMGLPLVVAGLAAAYVVLLSVGSYLLGNLSGAGFAALLAVLGGLLGVGLLAACVSWMSAVLTRASLHTLLGDGFAPDSRISWRQARAMFWPMVGLSLLSGAAASVANSAVSVLYYAVIIPFGVAEMDSTEALVVMSVLLVVIAVVLYGAAYSYLALAVPAWSVENAGMPGWIGKPVRPTNIATAFVRSCVLIGVRDLPRATAVFAAVFGIGLIVSAAVYLGLLIVIVLYADVVGLDLLGRLDAETGAWAVGGSYAVTVVLVFSALIAFLASVQTVLYLDLRMRREGLDLALRFDEVEVPQPSPPPVARLVPLMVPPPSGPPGYPPPPGPRP